MAGRVSDDCSSGSHAEMRRSATPAAGRRGTPRGCRAGDASIRTPAMTAAAKQVLSAIGDDLDHQAVGVLMHGPWRWHRRAGEESRALTKRRAAVAEGPRTALSGRQPSRDVNGCRTALQQHLAEIGASSDASGAGNFVAALIDRCRLCVGIEIVRRVIADADSPLVQVTGVTLSAIRAADAERALELAQTLVNTALTAAQNECRGCLRLGAWMRTRRFRHAELAMIM